MSFEIGWRLFAAVVITAFWWGLCVLAREGRRRP